ncbi:MAG: hypothetical protein ACI9WT_000924 [Flavobacterium sp.]|jgi:hypothetical protein
MKTYYLHNGNENEGPFDLEQLRSKIINRTTPVWSAGMEDWKRAGEMEDLKSILASVPPPIKHSITTPSGPEDKKKGENRKILGLTKKNFFLVTGVLVLVMGVIITDYLQANRKTDFEQKNSLTEKNNQQYKLQQIEIQEQKNRVAEQESLEMERAAKEEKLAINNRILEIKNSISVNYDSLRKAKNALNDAAEFQFLRTTDQRINDIDLAQNNIEYLKNEIAALEQELDLSYLKLEKVR